MEVLGKETAVAVGIHKCRDASTCCSRLGLLELHVAWYKQQWLFRVCVCGCVCVGVCVWVCVCGCVCMGGMGG